MAYNSRNEFGPWSRRACSEQFTIKTVSFGWVITFHETMNYKECIYQVFLLWEICYVLLWFINISDTPISRRSLHTSYFSTVRVSVLLLQKAESVNTENYMTLGCARTWNYLGLRDTCHLSSADSPRLSHHHHHQKTKPVTELGKYCTSPKWPRPHVTECQGDVRPARSCITNSIECAASLFK